MSHDVFLSYSRKDTGIMQRVKSDFVAAGLVVWTDEGIELNSLSWKIEIERAIREANCFVCILTPDAVKSRWVREELSFAEEQGKSTFLVLARGNPSTSVPFGYTDHQRSDIRDETQYLQQIEGLIRSIHALVSLTDAFHVAHNILPPPFEWCEISGGTIEVDSTVHQIDTFWIAKYPVTNLQFQSFLDAPDGYMYPGLWEKLPPVSQRWFRHIRAQAESNFSGDWCPREMVNWHEALAFCYWLSEKLNLAITLPTKEQRLWLIRGNTGHDYPWGMEFDSTRCNTREYMIDRTTSVTKYPDGSSIDGVMDLSGNVWEWSLTDYIGEAGKTEGYYMYGGGWRGRRRHVRAIFPRWKRPDYRAPDVGFRVCVAL